MRTLAILALAGLALGTTAEAKRLHLHRPARGFQMRMTPFAIPAGGEREACEYVVTPNGKAMDVSAFEMKTTPGAHHFVLWEYLGKDTDRADFWSGVKDATGCIGLGPRDGQVTTANLFGMLSGHQHVEFPAGVAVSLQPHAALYANLHLHNYTAAPVDAEAVFNLVPARKGSVQHHAQALTVGTIDFDIPAHGHAAVSGEWRAPVDLNIVQISTHEHHRGTRMSVSHMDASGNAMGDPLVVSEDWEHPNVTWFRQQPKRVRAGEGLRFTCEWQNNDDFPVQFGVTTEDEMCFVIGYFYPDDDGAKVKGPGCLPQGSGIECFVPKNP